MTVNHIKIKDSIAMLARLRQLFGLSFIIVVLSFISLTSSAQQGSTKYALAVEAYQSKDFPTAEHYWSELALEGDARAQYALGIMHLKKEAQRSADATAFQYLVEAAKQQHVAAMFNLGVAYWEGRGVFRQTEKAANWWEAAAQKNDASAQYNLGLAYYIGEGRNQDTESAVYWLQKATENDHTQARDLLDQLQQGDESIAEKRSEESDPPAPSKAEVQQAESDPASSSQSIETIAAKPDPTAAEKILVLRAAPARDAVQLSIISADSRVQLLQSQENWSQILAEEPYPVWIYESLVRELGEGLGEVRGTNVNIRPAPSKDEHISPPLGQLDDGDPLEIIERRKPWVKVIPPRAFPAWVEKNGERL